MSDAESKLEEGSKPEPSKEHKEGPNSIWERSFDVRNILVILIILLLLMILLIFGGIMIVLYLLVIVFVIAKWLAHVVKQNPLLIVSVIAITLDPCFFYIPVLNDGKKCIHWDKTLGITATVLRSFLDFLKLVPIISELSEMQGRYKRKPKKSRLMPTGEKYKYKRKKSRFRLFVEKILKENGKGILESRMGSLIDILAILPFPQMSVIFGITGTEFSSGVTFFVLQYVIRVIRTYFLFTQATGISGVLADATRAIVAFYFLLYMLGGHVFGALWYYYAIEKATACWKIACRNHTGCGHRSFLCDDSLGDYNFLNDFCGVNTGNTTSFNFGLYNDAFQSGIVEETHFFKKLLRCLKWGLQNLSAFGQSLQTSNDVGENIFAICMTIIGVVLFVFLIGKMQADATKSETINQRWQQITQWTRFEEITADVQRQIRKDKCKNWQNRPVKLIGLMNDLHEDTARKVKRQIGRKLLLKVQHFKNWNEYLLDDLCDCLKPAFFNESARIIRERDTIDKMLFVLKGKIWTYTSTNEMASSKNVITDSMSINENLVEDGGFCGEELIIACAQDESLPKLPTSDKTYQALTNVEGFTLLARELRRVSLLREVVRAAHFIQCRRRFIRHLRDKRKGEKRSLLISLLESCCTRKRELH